MPRKKYKHEEIVGKPRQVDVLVSQESGVVDTIRQIGVSEVTYYRWRREFGGRKISRSDRLVSNASQRTPLWLGRPPPV